MANYSQISPDFQGRKKFIMKIIFSSISRLFFAYSKFILMVTMLSSLNTTAHSSDATYLECDNRYYRLTGTHLESNYNIRTKKFKFKMEIYSYGVDFINLGREGKINRNTGEWTVKNGVRFCKKINFTDLPKINEKGKLF